jgi:hypothetical protein
MTENLQEFCDCRGLSMRLDREAGVIRGVKILGLQSRNGRNYLPEALARAAALYEDAKVNVNHPRGNPGEPRDYQDRIGAVRNVTARPDGLFADFHFNPRHPLAEQLLWDAEHAPQNVGFSHNVEARTARQGDRVVVEAITRVQSVDLVADPATTRGLFEEEGEEGEKGVKGVKGAFEALKREHPEIAEAIVAEQAAEVQRLREEIERLQGVEAAQQRRELVQRLFREYRLPDPDSADPQAKAITSRQFVESLMAAKDETAVRALVEERAALVRSLAGDALNVSGRPRSRDQQLSDGRTPADARAFAQAIT